MNERIKELEAQCWEPRQYGPAWFNSKKFAELIVRECASLVENFTYLEEMGLDDYKEITGKEMILSTFGVEE